MKIKELIEKLKQLPEDSNISMWWKDFHIAVKYYAYDEDIDDYCWSVENDIKYFLNHRSRYPEKVRYIFMENDKDFYKYNKEEVG